MKEPLSERIYSWKMGGNIFGHIHADMGVVLHEGINNQIIPRTGELHEFIFQ